ncbi:MAG: glycosyltransferase [Ignavibacteria bacterium]|nr:glycosyltransferase [Ignavibacteria bacterium]
MNDLTVLMTTYNNAEYLSASIRSILNQTYNNFNFIIVDDGSTDNSKEIIDGFKDERIKYYRIENSGLGAALNYGLKLSETELIVRMDADDISLPDRIAKQYNFISKNKNYDIISSWYSAFENIKLLYTIRTPESDEEIKKRFALHSEVIHAGMLYKKDKIISNGGYKPIVFEDYELWLRIKDKVKFYNLQEVLLLVRYRTNSFSRENIVEKNKLVYAIQAPYYGNDFQKNFLLKSEVEESKLRGWREFFYGEEKKATVYWNKIGISLFAMPRIIIAKLVLLFPKKFILWFKENRIRFRLKYFLSYFSDENIKLRKFLSGT